jgi:glycosyltransferase involved in cell wall biosynthesis
MKLNVLLLRPSKETFQLPETKFYQWKVVTEQDLQHEQVTKAEKFFDALAKWKPVAIFSVCSHDDFHRHFGFLSTMPHHIVRKWMHLQTISDFHENTINQILFTVVSGHPFSKDNPLMSIITSTFHSGEKLLRPMKSLLQQTYGNWEWIIWDDSKDDSMWPSLQKIASCDHRIKVFKPREHSGYIGEMKRLACGVAEGEWLIEVDHDDEFDPQLLEWILLASRKHPDVDFIYTDSSEIYEESKECHTYGDFFAFGYGAHVHEWNDFRKRWFAPAVTQGPNPRTLQHIVGVPNHVRAWKTSLYNKIGKHNSLLPVCDDYELLLRTFLQGTWLHIPMCAYIQYRNANGNNFTFLRNEMIQHASAWIWDKYKPRVQQKFLELNVPLDSTEAYKPVWHMETEIFAPLHKTWLPAPFSVESTISIICPTFDRRDLLLKAIKSVCAQNDKDWMLFVVGDKCPTLQATMGELETIPEIRPHLFRIRWWNLSERNKKWGAVSRNYALHMLSKTDWVTYLDDDNEWLPEHLSSMRACAAQTPAAEAIFASLLVEGKPILCKEAVFGRVDASSFMHKRSLAGEFGFWPMESVSYANDWKFVEPWVRAGVDMGFTQKATVVYNTSTNAQTYDSILALRPHAPVQRTERRKKALLTASTIPHIVDLEWTNRKLDIALSFNDRYVGFFEPFANDVDAVLTDNCLFHEKEINSITCFMTLRALSSTPSQVTLYQTEQLSRSKELARVASEIQNAVAAGTRVKVLQYSKFNMKVLSERLPNVAFEHVYKPLVTSPEDVRKLQNLLRVLVRTDDLGFSCGPSERRSKTVARLRELGFTVRFIDHSFGQERDVGVASCHVLLNIHADDDFRVFETSRCLRWLDAGHTVVTEPSEDLDEYTSKYPNLIVLPFASILEGNFGPRLPMLAKRKTSDWIEEKVSAWKGHRGFAEWLVRRVQPKIVVDLGVDYGYSTFVWASAGKPLGTEVFGVDIFEGDGHTGTRQTFDSVTRDVEEHGLDNVSILRADFASVAKVWCRPVDILHIDGFHTEEAVRADFKAWSPHVRNGGVILFHDTAIQDYGVKDFFATLPPECCFSFPHSCGLGVYTKNKELLQEIRSFKGS